jgi:hypothetical protein
MTESAVIMFPLTTTLNRVKACDPCDVGWQAGLRALGKTGPDDELISYELILDAVGLDQALWCCQAEKQYNSLWRRYAVWCARQVQHLMTDQRSIAALDVAERHANGAATDEELDAAARAAARAAGAAAWAAGAAARAAGAAGAAARAAARADGAAAWAAGAAARAAGAAGAAARAAARDAQATAFRQLVTTGMLQQNKHKPEAP